MRTALKLFILMAFLISFCHVATGDTGTYQILDYRVKLTPKSNGTVQIEYYQKWMVIGGSIPWITVGTPNNDFVIVSGSSKGNAASFYPANEGDWSGVRVNLDHNYGPGKTFEIGFTIIENRLFYASGDNYKLVFWPGWYDRAKTDSLHVEMFFYAKLDTIKAEPKPARIEGQSMIWQRKNLAPGEKFKISVSIPRAFMPGKIATGPKYAFLSAIPWPLIFGGLILLGIFIVIAFGNRYGPGPVIYYGGGRGSGSAKGGKGGGIFSGGGGGFGGRSASCVCACACAGCACACACAGGGAAGCERKLSHRCSLCRQCNKRHDCPIWRAA